MVVRLLLFVGALFGWAAAAVAEDTASAPPGIAHQLCTSARLISQHELEGGPGWEISGLAASRSQPGVFWAHRDSGSEPQLLALSAEGVLLNVVNIRGAQNRDWEDMALARDADGGYSIYLADIGDNKRRWPYITIYRVAEPQLTGDGSALDAEVLTTAQYRYPDGPRNAESFFIDERDGRFYLVTKETRKKFFWPFPDGPSALYSATLSPTTPAPHPLRYEREIDFVGLESRGHAEFREEVGSRPVAEATTAADMHPDSGVIGVRTYGSLWLWQVQAGQGVADAMAGPPCEAPTAIEIGGEALAFSADGKGYATTAEYFSSLSVFGLVPAEQSGRTQ